MPEEYRVRLDVFTGPLDLLLYLIRRDELDIQDIPIARVTEQYLEYVKLLEVLDPNAAGDFLVLASTLVELKSRALLPSPPLESEEDEDDPQRVLVRQLLEYKRFKDAAESLSEAAEERAQRYVRVPADLPPDLQGVELEDVEPWDLLSAFGKVMSAVGRGPGTHDVRYDDTPIEAHIDAVLKRLNRQSPLKFGELFDSRVDRARIVGLFLALLELIRSQRLRAEQDRVFGTIYLFLLERVENDTPPPPLAIRRDETEAAAENEPESYNGQTE